MLNNGDCQRLGFKNFIPPYNDPSTVGEVIFHGVNYPSGGSGILDLSGFMFLLSKSLFSAGIGSNNFALNYFTPFVSILNQTLIPLDAFVDSMISKNRLQLMTLYELGARKFVIQNVPPIGCVPFERALNKLWNGGSCVAPINDAAMLFNTKLKALVLELNSNLVGSQFVYADIYDIVWDLLSNYQSYGFENNDSACCRGLGPYGGLGLCRPT
ncbi:hypothetical protein MKX01_002649 [Papaver californicum]|nr:hypothetical protein MKX01_002649 [Papaver californicum]